MGDVKLGEAVGPMWGTRIHSTFTPDGAVLCPSTVESWTGAQHTNRHTLHGLPLFRSQIAASVGETHGPNDERHESRTATDGIALSAAALLGGPQPQQEVFELGERLLVHPECSCPHEQRGTPE